MNITILKRLLARLGLEKTAARLGRTPGTIKGWIKREHIPPSSVDAVGRAWRRSEGARKAAETRKRKAGISTPLPPPPVEKRIDMDIVDFLVGAESGYTESRLEERAEFHEDKFGEELPEPAGFLRMEDGPWSGAVFMVDENGDRWRMYTVDGKAFWTRAEQVEGYFTDDEFREQYGTMQGREVRLFF